MKNVNPTKVFKTALSFLMVAGLFFITSCGSDDTPAPVPSTIQFSASSASIMENSTDPVTLTVSFSEASTVAGSFAIGITSSDATYGTDFTTTPDGASGTINVTVATGDESVTLSVSAINNDDYTGDKTVTFTISSVEGITLGSTATLTLTIADDEMKPTDISALRTQFADQGAGTITGPQIIEGIVTSSRDNITGRNVFIQDATGGIVVRFNADNTDFDMGEMLRVNISDGTLDAFRGLLQISNLELTAATERGTGTLPDPKDITITELLTDNFQGMIVRLSDVAFDNADGTRTYNGSQGISDANGNETSTFIRSSAAFSGDVLPAGAGTITGIASSFDSPQIDLRTASDVSVTESATITIDASNITDFGKVNNGQSSAVQSYSLSASSLLGDVTVTAPSQFEVSLEMAANFGGMVTVPQATAEAGTTIYVRFTPTSTTNGVKDGNITNTSFSAIPKTIAVMGEETGNGSANTPTDLFFSEYVEGSSNNKYLEIFNGTGASIDLSDYEIRRFNNGGTDASSSTYPLSGMLADGQVIVIANSSATIYSGTVYSATDVNGATFYNGDDALVLWKVSTSKEVDIIGQVGCDPGSSWTDGNHSMANKTLRRKSSVTAGVTTNPTGACSATSFATMTTEWDVFDQNTVDGLGSHTIN